MKKGKERNKSIPTVYADKLLRITLEVFNRKIIRDAKVLKIICAVRYTELTIEKDKN